jgi:predicted Zn-ribbon and HTH transcriptional regulator
MKDEIVIPLPKEEDFVAANKRRDKYALKRDQQALEFNAAIVTRQQMEARHQVKCEKCGKEFSAGISTDDSPTCPECKSAN